MYSIWHKRVYLHVHVNVHGYINTCNSSKAFLMFEEEGKKTQLERHCMHTSMLIFLKYVKDILLPEQRAILLAVPY